MWQDWLYPALVTKAEIALDQAPPILIRDLAANKQLLAYLYSLSTPGVQENISFGSDMESVCVDTGASACISPHRINFTDLRPVTNLKINGIGSGLAIEGIGTLRWSFIDDSNNAIDLYIRDALYVPSTPMGLLCPQQIAQKTKHPGDGFQAIYPHGILQFAGHKKQSHMIPSPVYPSCTH